MMIEIDFSSDEAIYIQLTNQIIMGIATSRLQEGDTLPSVRQLADTVGINMHTVNKAYSLLRQEGFVTIDRRRGAVISIDVNKRKALEELKQNLMVALAKGCCKRAFSPAPVSPFVIPAPASLDTKAPMIPCMAILLVPLSLHFFASLSYFSASMLLFSFLAFSAFLYSSFSLCPAMSPK